MAEKRRGLGRGLGALIPSAPEEVPEEAPVEVAPQQEESSRTSATESSKKQGGRPVDLFFERVTLEDVAEQPRSYSSALRSGINKNVLEAQTKRVAKSSARKTTAAGSGTKGRAESSEQPAHQGGAEEGAGARSEQQEALKKSVPDGSAKVVPAPSVVSAADAQASATETAGADAERQDVGSTPRSRAGSARTAITSPAESKDDRSDLPSATESGSRETPTTDEAAPTTSEAKSQDGLLQVPGATFAELPLDSIHPNRKQPRVEFNEDELAELVHSIREIGVLQPVVVRPSQENGETGYELVMGERRWRASREAGLAVIPAIIRSTLDDDLLRDALLENLHRSALNPLEEAAAYQQLLDDFGCSHDELAGRLGRSRPQISNTLRLMKLPPLVQRRVAAGVLSAGHARALLGLADAADMEKLAQRIVAEGLSVRSTEEIVALSGGLRRASKPSTPRDGARHERLDYLATSLSDRLDTNVKITLGAKKGRVSIEFASVDDLNRIIGVLSPAAD